MTSRQSAFTLLEILLASVAAAMILVIVYGIFTSALHMRDNATARIRESRLRARASAILRRDLQGALISGGVLATTLEGDAKKQSNVGGASAPGYLKLTTTTGKDTADDLYGDVQEVEYYITRDTENSANPRQGGTLVRAVTRDLLAATTIATPHEEQILTGVESLQVAFYDGTTWQESWQANPTTYGTSTGGTGSTSTANGSSAASSATTGSTSAGTVAQYLPQAIRIDIQQSAPSLKASIPPPLEILVPWTTQPFTAPTPTPTPGN